MSLSKADTIAEAIKTALNAGPLVAQVASVRKHAFKTTLEELARVDESDADEPLVTVYPVGETKTRTSRATWQHIYTIGISVQSYCDFTNTTRLDELTLFTEGLLDFLANAGTMANATFLQLDHDQLFDPSQLHDRQQFFTTPNLTYRLERGS